MSSAGRSGWGYRPLLPSPSLLVGLGRIGRKEGEEQEEKHRRGRNGEAHEAKQWEKASRERKAAEQVDGTLSLPQPSLHC